MWRCHVPLKAPLKAPLKPPCTMELMWTACYKLLMLCKKVYKQLCGGVPLKAPLKAPLRPPCTMLWNLCGVFNNLNSICGQHVTKP